MVGLWGCLLWKGYSVQGLAEKPPVETPRHFLGTWHAFSVSVFLQFGGLPGQKYLILYYLFLLIECHLKTF